MLSLTGKKIVVIGGSRGVGLRIVEAAIGNGGQVLAVARQQAPLRQPAQEIPGTEVLSLDATDEGATAKVFDVLEPDILVLCAGAFPPAAPLYQQSWQEFAVNWETDVKIAFHFCKAALSRPLQLDCLDRKWRCCCRVADFGRICRRQAHADVHRELQSEGIGSAWARLALHGPSAAHHAGHRARQVCGRGLFPLPRHI